MTKEEKTILALVKTALSGVVETISDGVDWAKLIEEATEQGVLGVCFEAVEKLPPEQRPDMDNLMEFLGQTEYQVTQYEEHKKAVKKLASICHANDLRLLLLKGYGLSLNYLVPEHRPTGDIDIFLFGNQDKLDRIAEEHGVKVERKNNHHSTFKFHGVTVENHKTLLDQNSDKSSKRLESMFQKELMDENVKLYECPIPNCYLPSATLNAIYLLRHAGLHFAVDKIKLRHVLDLGTFFKKHSDEVEWDEVLRVYRQENMIDFYNAIATICTRELGLDGSCFTSTGSAQALCFLERPDLADRVLEDIFTKDEELPMSTKGIQGFDKLKYNWKKTRRFINNRWKYRMVFKDGLLESFVYHAINRIKNNHIDEK